MQKFFQLTILIAVFIAGSVASADDHYARLKELYDAGTLPTKSDLAGWHSGRCYRNNAPSTPIAQILVAGESKSGANHGPGFPASSKYKILSVTEPSKAADYFDSMTIEKRHIVEQVLSFTLDGITEAKAVQGSLVSENIPQNVAYRLRKSGEYFVMAATQISTSEGQSAGDAFGMCYYFKKVD